MTKSHNFHWRQHVALDIGTATTRIAAGMNLLVEKPSVVEGRPALANGVVVDPEAVARILEPLLERRRVFGIVKPYVLACAPSDARSDERELLADSIMKAGAASVSMMPEPLAAAIGSGLDVSSPYAQAVIDIGEGVTDCAVIHSGRVQATFAIRQGCFHMRRSIEKAASDRGWTMADEGQVEMLMRTCGLRGCADEAGSALAAAGLHGVLEKIASAIAAFMKDLPDSLACDVIDSGICLTGGGALIPGVREYLEQHLRISIKTAGNPLASVAEGARAVLPVVLSLNEW